MGETFYYIDPDGNTRALNDSVVTFLGPRAGFGLQEVVPIGEQTPHTAGLDFKGLYSPSRMLMIRIGISCASQSALVAFERALRSDLNPYIDKDNPGTLRMVTADGLTRDIDCFPLAYPDDSVDRQVMYANRVLRFWAPDPWFYDPTQQEDTAVLDVDGGLEFPVFAPAAEPIAFNQTDVDDTIEVTNAGDVDTWPVIRVTGAGTNIVITNVTTDKLVDITQATDADDYIEIDMDAGTIEFYDDSEGTTTSILSALSSASEFWPLVQGANSIRFQFPGGAGAVMLITWYDRFIGV